MDPTLWRLSVFWLVIGMPGALWADTGGLKVMVQNATTQRVMAGVAVRLESRAGQVQDVVTDADGSADLSGLDVGLYELTASLEGFVSVTEPSVRVVKRRATTVKLRLRPADTIEELMVTARAIDVDPYGSVSESYLNREELRSAVGAGSDALRALDGLPGLVSTGDFANFTVRGRGPRDNLILVDEFPFDKVVHFDQTLGEEEDIGGGGRFSIFAPNSIGGAEFSPGGWSAAYGGPAGSLLKLNVAEGNTSPTASLRLDLAGAEFGYDGPSGLHDGTTVLFSARRFDFGQLFETIEELDIGEPVLTDVLLKTVTQLENGDSLEFLLLTTPEDFTRDITHVVESPDFEDVAVLTAEQDSQLFGVTYKKLVGQTGEWANRFYYRNSDKVSSEGEAFPDLVPLGTAPEAIPVRDNILTVGEAETEIGWRSDFKSTNRFGQLHAGLRLRQIDADFFSELSGDWNRFVYDQDDTRPPGQNFIVLTPDAINTTFSRSELIASVFAEQVFEFDQWDFRTGLRFDRDGFSEESLISPRFSINRAISQRLRFSASAGVFYQAPAIFRSRSRRLQLSSRE